MSDPQTPAPEVTPPPAAAAAPAADPPKSWEDEVAEAVGKSAAAAAGQAPAPSEEPAPPAEPTDDGESPAPEPEKQDEPPPKAAERPADLSQRLALLAKGKRELEVGQKHIETQRAELQPIVELRDKLRAASNDRVAVIRELLGGEEQFRDFYLEATDAIHTGSSGADATKAKAEKPLTRAELEDLVEKGVQKRIEAMGQAELAQAKGAYVREARATLESAADRFPHLYAAPPSDRAITDISDAILASTGKLPSAETVLETIESHRRERYEAKAKKPGQTSPATKPAAAAQPSKTSGEKPTQPIRRNNVPVVPPRAMTFDEEVEAAVAAAAQARA